MGWMTDGLKNVVTSYDAFCHIAERLAWIETEEQHENRGSYPLGIFLDMYEFPQGYIQGNIAYAYVRACLSGMAFCEEWDRDFWDIPLDERKQCLTKGRWLYESYAIVKDARFIERDWNYLIREIELFSHEKGISKSDRRRYTDRFENAEVLELGGAYQSDYIYLAVERNRMLMVSCGFWD